MVNPVAKLETGIAGFDLISDGGLPQSRTTLVAGTAGSTKTVFSAQFLVTGILRGENGVFVTFEETPDSIRHNMAGFGWNIAEWEAEGRWTFVDASPQLEELLIAGEYDFGAMLARVRHAVQKVNAQRVSIDSLSAMFMQFSNANAIRRDMLRVMRELGEMNVTSVITAERTSEYGEITRFGVEEYAADNVVILRNVLNDERRRRTVEILKLRGTSHQEGEFPFTVTNEDGIVVFPITAVELRQGATSERVSSGVAELDAMSSGGFFRDSVTLISGATGTGKTLLVSHFLDEGLKRGERCLLFAYEESRDQIYRNASGWGIDIQQYEASGQLLIEADYPEAYTLEDHLIRFRAIMNNFQPTRVAVDSLTALQRVSTGKGFREFVISVTSFIKQQEITCVFTATSPTLVGGTSLAEGHISSMTDSIIMLRYGEIYGEMNRGIAILKMRGSAHDKQIRQYFIDGQGMHIGKAFRNVSGILAGNPVHVSYEAERIEQLFTDDKE